MSKPTGNELIMRSLSFLLEVEHAKLWLAGKRGAADVASELVTELDASIAEAKSERQS